MEGNTVLAALKSLARCQKLLSESLLENDGTQLENYPSSYPIGIFLSNQLKLDKEKPSANLKQLEESLKCFIFPQIPLGSNLYCTYLESINFLNSFRLHYRNNYDNSGKYLQNMICYINDFMKWFKYISA